MGVFALVVELDDHFARGRLSGGRGCSSYSTALTPRRGAGRRFFGGRRCGAGGGRRRRRRRGRGGCGSQVHQCFVRARPGAAWPWRLHVLDDALRVPLPGAASAARRGAPRRRGAERHRATISAASASARIAPAAAPHAFTSVGRAKPEAPGMIGAGVVPEPLLEQRAVHRRGSRWSRAGFRFRRGSPGRGIRRPSRPWLWSRSTKAQPAAPWSVPSEPFSSGRRPNSLHISTRTRSARPRASRSRWKASTPSQVSRRLRVEVFGLVGVGVVAAGGADRHHPHRQPDGDEGGEPGELVGEVGFRVGDRAGEVADAAEVLRAACRSGRSRGAPGASAGRVRRAASRSGRSSCTSRRRPGR